MKPRTPEPLRLFWRGFVSGWREARVPPALAATAAAVGALAAVSALAD